MKDLTKAHEAICKAATILDRDILRRQTFTNIMPVPQGDIMQDFRLWVPEEGIQRLYKFWHAHVHLTLLTSRSQELTPKSR